MACNANILSSIQLTTTHLGIRSVFLMKRSEWCVNIDMISIQNFEEYAVSYKNDIYIQPIVDKRYKLQSILSENVRMYWFLKQINRG